LKKGFLVAVLLILIGITTGLAFAAQPIAIIVNGVQVKSDVPPQIINGRTMVPLRAVAEALDADVAWNQAANTVSITREEPPKLMKFNGEATTWPYWVEDGELYMERRNCLELLRTKYPAPFYSVSITSSTLAINNRSYYIPECKKQGDYQLVPINEIAVKGVIKYDWQPETGNLTLIDK
jgi:hypothetical protein